MWLLAFLHSPFYWYISCQPLTNQGVSPRRLRQLSFNRGSPRKLESRAQHQLWMFAGRTAKTHLRLATTWLSPSWPEEKISWTNGFKESVQMNVWLLSKNMKSAEPPGPAWPWSSAGCSPFWHRSLAEVFLLKKTHDLKLRPRQTLKRMMPESAANSARKHCLNNLVNVCFLITVSLLLFWQMSFWR